MGLNDIYNFCYRLVFIHPFISIGAVAILGIIIYLKPKEIVKVLAIFAGILIVIYLLSYLSGATKAGYIDKEKMIYESTKDDENEDEDDDN
jgi:hypothetical protein